MSDSGRHQFEKGFTLIELVATLVLLGIISIVVLPKLVDSKSFDVRAAQDQIKSSVALAQQLALSGTGTIVLQTTSNTVDVRIDGGSVSFGNTHYPLQMPSGITMSAASLNFNKLGQTGGAVISISNAAGSGQVTVETSGYAH